MANTKMSTEVRTNVRFNALEKSILLEMGYELEKIGNETEFTLKSMIKLNGRIAKGMDPNNEEWHIPERFLKEDLTNTVPAKQLFKETEKIIANMERQKVILDQFNYDNNAEL